MIAINHPLLGMSPNQSGEIYSRISPVMVRPFTPVPTPAPAPSPAPPAVNQISPAPAPAPTGRAPEILVHISPVQATLPETPTVPTSTAIVTPEVPGSAAAATSPAPADTTGTFDSFLNWMTEETVFPGYPNGLVFAGGVIGALWIMSPKKGRR